MSRIAIPYKWASLLAAPNTLIREVRDLVDYINGSHLEGQNLSLLIGALVDLGINANQIASNLSTLTLTCYLLARSNELQYIHKQVLVADSPISRAVDQIRQVMRSSRTTDIGHLLLYLGDFPQDAADRVRVILDYAAFMKVSVPSSPQLQPVEV